MFCLIDCAPFKKETKKWLFRSFLGNIYIQAKQWAPDVTISKPEIQKLVDGAMLTKLMIKHNVGVSVEHTYEIKKIDSDFFADEL